MLLLDPQKRQDLYGLRICYNIGAGMTLNIQNAPKRPLMTLKQSKLVKQRLL